MYILELTWTLNVFSFYDDKFLIITDSREALILPIFSFLALFHCCLTHFLLVWIGSPSVRFRRKIYQYRCNCSETWPEFPPSSNKAPETNMSRPQGCGSGSALDQCGSTTLPGRESNPGPEIVVEYSTKELASQILICLFGTLTLLYISRGAQAPR